MEEINIRPSTEADFTALIALFREFAEFEKLPDKMENSVERMKLEKQYFNAFVAETADKKIIGFASFFFSYYTWTGKSLYLDDLYVQESFRHQGIGKLLLEKVIAFAKVNQCHRMRWQVSSWNKNAQEFYKSMGAEIDDVEINCLLSLRD